MDSQAPGDAQVQEKKGSGCPSQDPEAALQHESTGATDDDDNNNGNSHDATTQISEKKSLGFHLSFIGIALVAFVFSLDATMLAVALPAITEQLAGTTLQSFWAGIAYLLCVVVTQPLYTGISDAFGRAPTLYSSILLFALGSVVFAIAQNMTTVVIGRVFQGLGGGGMDLMAEVIVADMTTLQERSLYLGLLAIPTAVGGILGPTLGALLSTNLSWRWIGWINLPILGAAFILLALFLRLRRIDTPIVDKLKRLDWGGAILSLVGATIFIVPLSWANALYPWASWQTLLPLFVGIALIVIFVLYEFKIPQFPIFPLRLFSSTSINLSLVGNFVYGASLYSLLQYIPLLYQAIKLQTAIESAVSLLPTSVISVVFAVLGVIMVGVIGKGYRWALRTCWVILTVGTGLLGLVGPETPTSMLMGLPVLWGAAIGALMRLLHLPMQAGVTNVDDTGLIIGLLLMVRQCGGVVGLALSASIFSSVFTSSIRNVELGGPLAVVEDASRAIGFIPHLKSSNAAPESLEPVLHAYAMAMRPIFYAMTGLSAVGLLTSIFTKDESLKRTDLGRQHFEE